MIDLLTCFLTFAFQSLENFTVCAGFIGMFGMFARPLPKQNYTQRSTTTKPRRNKPPKPRKSKGETPRKTTKPKREKPKVWEEPENTPERIARIEEMFRRGRGY